MNQLELRFARALDVITRKMRVVADDYAKKVRARYIASRPLTSDERERLAKHVASGGALCCFQGLNWLREQRIPEIWAQAINGWAYENLSCTSENSEAQAEAVRKLSLERLPKGFEE